MPSKDQVDRALELIGIRAANYEYFFSKLDDPEWIDPLRARGLFACPPKPERSEDGLLVRAVWWPQSQFLARVSARAPEEVLAILLATGTDNYAVIADFTEAAAKMPPELASKWAIKLRQWIQQASFVESLLVKEVRNLVLHLAGNGRSKIALDLLAALLEVLPDPKAKEAEGGDEPGGRRGFLEPGAKCDQYAFQETLQIVVPSVAGIEPIPTLELLCDLLEKTACFSFPEEQARKPLDYSFIRRPAIEDHGQNQDDRFGNSLIAAVRDVSAKICGDMPQEFEHVISEVEAHGWDIFRRIGLHLLRVSEAPPPRLVEERLVDPELFDCIGVHHEYYHLLRRRFAELSPEGQAIILAWIDSGEHHKAYLDKHEQDWSEEQRAANLRYWQYTKLLCIEKDLSGEHARRLEDLRREFGEPGIPPDFHSWMGGVRWLGQQSPKPTEELGLLPVKDLVGFLKSWKAPGEFDGPSPEGLGSGIEALIARAPEKYAAGIEHFKDGALASLYLGYVVAGFAKALENGKTFPFEPLLALCGWIVDSSEAARRQAADGPGGRREEWERPRHDIARLLTKLFDDKYGFPIGLRVSVWRIIEPLTNDPDPDLAYEARYGGENMDPLSLSINSIRGNAMHGVVHYALWVCRKNEINTASGSKRRLSLADMPEVRAVLDAHLDPGKSQFALNQMDRAVYGDWLPQLMYVDEEWVRANLGRVFPESPEERHLRRAAWNTYVVYVPQIYKQVCDLIKGIYRDEIRRLATDESRKRGYHDLAQKLGEHAAVIYARGWDDLAEGSLVDLFFANAPEELRAHVLGFLGRDLRKDTPLGDDTVARFKRLWEWRVTALAGADKVAEKELGEFGWWFASGRCGEEWALDHLETVLLRTGALSDEMGVFEHMAQVFEQFPKESLRCLKLYVEKTQNPWFFGLAREGGPWEILRKGIAHEAAEVCEASEEIVHLLGSKGYLQYREILKMERGS